MIKNIAFAIAASVALGGCAVAAPFPERCNPSVGNWDHAATTSCAKSDDSAVKTKPKKDGK